MKQILLNWLLKDINRFEVINHFDSKYDIGRILSSKGDNRVSTSLQDDNKTLKIFI